MTADSTCFQISTETVSFHLLLQEQLKVAIRKSQRIDNKRPSLERLPQWQSVTHFEGYPSFLLAKTTIPRFSTSSLVAPLPHLQWPDLRPWRLSPGLYRR